MTKNFSTLITTLLIIIIFISCFIAFYLVNKNNSLIENQKVMESLILDLDEDIHEVQEKLLVIETKVND